MEVSGSILHKWNIENIMRSLNSGLTVDENRIYKNAFKRTVKPQLGKNSMTQSLFPSKKTSFNFSNVHLLNQFLSSVRSVLSSHSPV